MMHEMRDMPPPPPYGFPPGPPMHGYDPHQDPHYDPHQDPHCDPHHNPHCDPHMPPPGVYQQYPHQQMPGPMYGAPQQYPQQTLGPLAYGNQMAPSGFNPQSPVYPNTPNPAVIPPQASVPHQGLNYPEKKDSTTVERTVTPASKLQGLVMKASDQAKKEEKPADNPAEKKAPDLKYDQ